MGIGYNASIVTDDLILCLDAGNVKSYPGSGTTWTDLTGYQNGTLTAGQTYSSENFGSIGFAGASNQIVTVGAANQYFYGGNLSFFQIVK